MMKLLNVQYYSANEIAEMEKEGLIRGYKTVVDWDQLDNTYVSAIIELKVTPKAGFGFEEVAFLLLMGHLPSASEMAGFTEIMNQAKRLPKGFTEDMIMKSPSKDIMNKLSRSVLSLYSYDDNPDDLSVENLLLQSVKLIGAFPSIVANAYAVKRHYVEGRSLHIHFPKENLSTAENLLRITESLQPLAHIGAGRAGLALMVAQVFHHAGQIQCGIIHVFLLGNDLQGNASEIHAVHGVYAGRGIRNYSIVHIMLLQNR